MIDEDPFPPVDSVNIAATYFWVVLNEKKDERFSTNAKIRKIYIPKQYLVHKDELAVKGKVSTTKEKEKSRMHPYHSKKEKPSKGKNVSLKERHSFLERKGMNTSRRKIPLRFVISPPVLPGQKWHVVQHKKFPQKLTRTQKRKIQRLRAMEKRKLPEEMP